MNSKTRLWVSQTTPESVVEMGRFKSHLKKMFMATIISHHYRPGQTCFLDIRLVWKQEDNEPLPDEQLVAVLLKEYAPVELTKIVPWMNVLNVNVYSVARKKSTTQQRMLVVDVEMQLSE